MQKPKATLTHAFNTATVRKGDAFEVQMIGGGLIGAKWDAQIVSGKATLIEKSSKKSGAIGCAPITQKWVYRADEAGEIEIAAKEQVLGTTHTFKVRVI